MEHTTCSRTWKVELCDFEVYLAYRASSRTDAKAKQRNPVCYLLMRDRNGGDLDRRGGGQLLGRVKGGESEYTM